MSLKKRNPEFTRLGTWCNENRPQHVARCTIPMTEMVWKMVVSLAEWGEPCVVAMVYHLLPW